MNYFFNTYSTALFARVTGRLVLKCSSSGVTIFRWRRIYDHHAAPKTVCEFEFLLKRLCVRCYSLRKASVVGKSKTRKSDSKLISIMEEEKNAFYVVRKGDLVGVYKNLSDCQAQVGTSVCDPPVSVYKGYTMHKEVEEQMLSFGLKNALYSIRAADLTGELFGSLVPCPFQQQQFSIGEPSSDHLLKRKSQKIMGSQNEEAFELASMSNDNARKHMKLEHRVETQALALSVDRGCLLEFDGASKGNPGQAGAGAVLRSDDGSLICRLREGLGIATNNVAEYRALNLGLKYALSKGFTSIRVVGDSKLVCMQVQGLWKVKNQNIVKWYEEAKKLKDKFLHFQISHVLRDLNSDADAQANLAVNLAVGQVQEEGNT